MSECVLETRGLTRRFGSLDAVKDLSIRVRRGEVYGFLGPNGAGKTTSICMMAGLLKATSGTIHVLGEEVRPGRGSALRRLGVCPQENVLYPELTARENLEYAATLFDVRRRERRPRAEALLERLGLTAKAGVRAEKLSGGMKRRLTLAAALVHDPEVVILDEPEAGLDPQTRLEVREFIRNLRDERTVILTSHNMDEVERLADRVGILDHGALIREGTPHELKASLGAGDHVEVTLAGAGAEWVADILRAQGVGEVRVEDRTVVVRGHGLARQFPVVLGAIEKAGATLQDVRYRGNTLEDVFIHLTGRGLRE